MAEKAKNQLFLFLSKFNVRFDASIFSKHFQLLGRFRENPDFFFELTSKKINRFFVQNDNRAKSFEFLEYSKLMVKKVRNQNNGFSQKSDIRFQTFIFSKINEVIDKISENLFIFFLSMPKTINRFLLKNATS